METCGKCMGSGYGGHPDSGAVCADCNGQGGVRADLAQAPAPVRVPQIVIDQLNATVGEVGLEMVQAAEDAEFTGERVDLHDYQVSIRYDHAVTILAALEAPDAALMAELVGALRQSHEALLWCAREGRMASPLLHQYPAKWAAEAGAVLAKLGGK